MPVTSSCVVTDASNANCTLITILPLVSRLVDTVILSCGKPAADAMLSATLCLMASNLVASLMMLSASAV